MIDRIVAVVDGEIITLGQLQRVLSLSTADSAATAAGVCGDAATAENGASEAIEQRVLDCMIDNLLMYQHVRRFPLIGAIQDEVDAAYLALIASVGSRDAWEEELARLGFTAAEVRYDLERQLLVDGYINSRYREIIDVRATDLQRYYDDVLIPELERQGAPIPALDAVDHLIRPILIETEVNRRVDEWIAGLRRRAEIVVYVW